MNLIKQKQKRQSQCCCYYFISPLELLYVSVWFSFQFNLLLAQKWQFQYFMKRKQRKSLQWKRIKYMILIIMEFSELLLWFPPRIVNGLRSIIKHSKECWDIQTIWRWLKDTTGPCFSSTHFLEFGYLIKHSSLCLIYYCTSSFHNFH